MKRKTYIKVRCTTETTDESGNGKVILMRNSLLEPIHGVSLYDYAAVSANMSWDVETSEICKSFGIEPDAFEKASAIWIQRMQNNKTLEIAELFSKYFCEAAGAVVNGE